MSDQNQDPWWVSVLVIALPILAALLFLLAASDGGCAEGIWRCGP